MTAVNRHGEAVRAADERCAPYTRGAALLSTGSAVPALRPGLDLDAAELSPFERHVATFINGVRPVLRIQTKSGLSEDDVRIGLAMLAS